MVKGLLCKKPGVNAFKKEPEGKAQQEMGLRFNFSAKVEQGKEAEYLEMIKVEQNKFLQLAKIAAVPDGQENMDPSSKVVENMQNLSPITPNDHKSQNQKGLVSFSGQSIDQSSASILSI